MVEFFRRMYWILNTQFGFNPRVLVRSIRGGPRFVQDLLQFKRAYRGDLVLKPCLYDRYEEGGESKNEYFWQDLYVAQRINQHDPKRHVDIGSRLDGFIAHVASFRELEVFDIRPITPIIPRVSYRQANLMNAEGLPLAYCDSLSCLHALEHFGLGRYGDPIDVNGYLAGLANMAKVLGDGGVFYLSVPIGRPRVEFNANRVFDPVELCNVARSNGLILKDFAWVSEGKKLNQSTSFESDFISLGALHYSLGIFTFLKVCE